MSQEKIIVWFRKDLRISDNPALNHAIKKGKIIPIYILDQEGSGDFKMGKSSCWWLHRSLKSLSKSLDGHLQIFKGKSEKILEKVIEETGATGVYWNICYEPWALDRDKKIEKKLIDQKIEIQIFNASLLWDPSQLVKDDGTPYKVFTPFFKNSCLKSQAPREIIAKSKNIDFVTTKMGIDIDDLDLLDKQVDERLSRHWQPGEDQAMNRLKHFIKNGLADYKIGRDFPEREVTSKLSPHLHFGEISPHQMWYLAQDVGHEYASRENIQTFLKELCWREFAYNVLYFNPTMPRKNLDAKFDEVPWGYNKKYFDAWTQGLTGYPIIDAAMRELYQTGFMHNRMRMVTASFLIKNLMIHWHKGEDWFWDYLVDADLASNSFNWQWVAGCGYDAAPYFRIFNPLLQAKKFDSKAEYIKKWVPELSKLPLKYIFEPDKTPQIILESSGVILGKNYPYPIIDVKKSAKVALEIFKKTFKS
jgi:deoxyribodipyrimidine photo-lyase